MYSYKKLVLYQKAEELVVLTYKTTSSYPKEELFGLVSQMRRAAVSVVSNIVEGYIKQSSKEYSRFLLISIGSLTELEVQIELSKDLNFINQLHYDKISSLISEVGKLLYSTQKSISKK